MKYLDVEKLDKVLTKRSADDISNAEICCAQVIVNQSGKRVIEKEFGTNGVQGEKLKKDATFRIASMTKPVTVLAVLQQVEKGNIDVIGQRRV